MRNKLRYIAMIVMLCTCNQFIVGQQLNSAEYFFDQDPGVGNGFPISGLNPTNGTSYDSVELNTTLALPNTLTPGLHRLFVRVANGTQWSVYEGARFMLKPSTGNTLTRMEYFFDQDPGVGNGTQLSPALSLDSALYNGIIPTTNLSTGNHFLCIRTQDMRGQWGNYQTTKFHINHSITNSSVDLMEYFYDQDPGTGNGQTIAVTGNIDSSAFSGSFNTLGLTTGRHQLYVRCRTNDGIWSSYERKQIHIVAGTNLITQAEYFFDQDPGTGNGQILSLNSSGMEAEYAGNISYSGLAPGKHYLFIRAKTENGVWGIYDSRKIQIYDNPLTGEYFFDIDPGVGNAAAILMNNTQPG